MVWIKIENENVIVAPPASTKTKEVDTTMLQSEEINIKRDVIDEKTGEVTTTVSETVTQTVEVPTTENVEYIVSGYNLDSNSEMLITDGYQNVSDDLYTLYQGGKAKVIDGTLKDITDTDEYKAKVQTALKIQFETNFTKTSLGWLRNVPTGYSSIVEAMNSAFNVVVAKSSLPAWGLQFYPEPDFTKYTTYDTVLAYLKANVIQSSEMTSTAFYELYAEFMTTWNTNNHVSATSTTESTT